MNFQWKNRNLSGFCLCLCVGKMDGGLWVWSDEGQNCLRRKKALTAETERHVTDRWAFSSSSCLVGQASLELVRHALVAALTHRLQIHLPQTYP